ncbi:MarR family transcriptional regulator [Nonomuraea monospora]|uniref:MarR family transcriptional regulator n=1 Tax=Nonomuraea monospora TaxID=568818 RepID=A0ABN3CGS2_9ACTN
MDIVEVTPASVQQRLRALHGAVERINRQVSERMGINRTDLQCLELIARHGPTPAGEIAKLMRLPTGTMTTVIDRVERAGLAVRQRSASDRRRVLVSLTDQGALRLLAMYAPLMATSAQNLSRYDAAELAVIDDFLRTSVQLTEQYSPPEPD